MEGKAVVALTLGVGTDLEVTGRPASHEKPGPI
jgi:hypothetical protein